MTSGKVRVNIRVRGVEARPLSGVLFSRVPTVGEQIILRRPGKLPQTLTVTAVAHDDFEECDAHLEAAAPGEPARPDAESAAKGGLDYREDERAIALATKLDVTIEAMAERIMAERIIATDRAGRAVEQRCEASFGGDLGLMLVHDEKARQAREFLAMVVASREDRRCDEAAPAAPKPVRDIHARIGGRW